MVDWQERISRGTAPAIRVEHDVRYAAAAPLILDSPVWADLGCGTGVSSAAALGGFHGRAVLVDVEADAVKTAAEELSDADVTPLVADLSDPEGVATARKAIDDGPAGPRTITCFETLEHLKSFPPLIATLTELAEAGDATVLLSVPNDAHWAIENPFHETSWGEGSFEELLRLLPQSRVVARQVPLTGSTLVVGDGAGSFDGLSVEVPEGLVPSHLLVAFGPRAEQFAATAAAAAVDLDEQRRWERQRESNVAFYEMQADELRAIASEHIARVDEFRTYVHELEDRLGIPRAGSADAPPAAPGR